MLKLPKMYRAWLPLLNIQIVTFLISSPFSPYKIQMLLTNYCHGTLVVPCDRSCCWGYCWVLPEARVGCLDLLGYRTVSAVDPWLDEADACLNCENVPSDMGHLWWVHHSTTFRWTGFCFFRAHHHRSLIVWPSYMVPILHIFMSHSYALFTKLLCYIR